MTERGSPSPGVGGVLGNRPFLLLWLSQVATQVGVNMVLYGLTVIVLKATSLSSAVSLLLLTFLVPAVLFSAVAGVYVDRIDRRWVLVITNLLRAAVLVGIWWAGTDVTTILLLNTLLSAITVFFVPAESAMIPYLVPRESLVSANGLFTLTLNGAFALGYALLGPLIVTVAGPEPLILSVAGLYLIASLFCVTLPSDPPAPRAHETPLEAVEEVVEEAGRAVGGVLSQLREGIAYIRINPHVGWSLIYLGIAASLVGVIGVLGPSFAESTLGLEPEDLVVVVLPLGLGIVTGILVLNSYGRYLARRRAIEVGLIALGILLLILTAAGPLSRFLQGVNEVTGLPDLSAVTSLVAVVIGIAFLAGMAYGVVAIASQTQLQEELPEEVRGRVFGVLNMLVSVASLLPIVIVGPISDLAGTTTVILIVAVLVFLSGLVSVVRRGPLQPVEVLATADTIVEGQAVDPIGVAIRTNGRSAAPVSRPARPAPGDGADAPDGANEG